MRPQIRVFSIPRTFCLMFFPNWGFWKQYKSSLAQRKACVHKDTAQVLPLWASASCGYKTCCHFQTFQRDFWVPFYIHQKKSSSHSQLWEKKPNQSLKWVWRWKLLPRKNHQALGRYKKQLRRSVRSKAKPFMWNYIGCNLTHTKKERKKDETRTP